MVFSTTEQIPTEGNETDSVGYTPIWMDVSLHPGWFNITAKTRTVAIHIRGGLVTDYCY